MTSDLLTRNGLAGHQLLIDESRKIIDTAANWVMDVINGYITESEFSHLRKYYEI